jgi:hypothetical protein
MTRPIPQLREALARCRELERAIDEALTAAEQGLTDDELEECDRRVWDQGVSVAMVDPPSSEAMEGLVAEAAAITPNDQIDWGYAGGRAFVKCIGRLARVRLAVLQALRGRSEGWAWKMLDD